MGVVGGRGVYKPQSSHAEKTFLGPTDELIKPQGMSHIEIPDQNAIAFKPIFKVHQTYAVYFMK